MNEKLDGMSIEPCGVWKGSGFCALDVQRREGGFCITLHTWLQSHEQHELRGAVAQPVTLLLP